MNKDSFDYSPITPCGTAYYVHLENPDIRKDSYDEKKSWGISLLFKKGTDEWEDAKKHFNNELNRYISEEREKGIIAKDPRYIDKKHFPIKFLQNPIKGFDVSIKFKSLFEISNIIDLDNKKLSIDSIKPGDKVKVCYKISYYFDDKIGYYGYAFRPNSIQLVESCIPLINDPSYMFSENLKKQEEIYKEKSKNSSVDFLSMEEDEGIPF